jgi:release factor glutamine methyltransferase
VPGNTVHDALDAAVEALKAAGCESARLDAEVLLAQATGWDRAHLAAEPAARLPVGASRNFGEMVRRKGFRRVELLVDRRVLIPRPETELLVDLALELQPARVIDVGTGSGAIALAVADELDDALVTAIDTSFDAVRVAQANAERLGLTDRVDVVLRGPSALDGAGAVGPPFDLLVANLPYVSEEEWDGLAPEIRDYEPREALVPGPTGLEAIEALAEELFGLAPRPSVVALEIGAGQADEVTRLIRAAGYEETEVRRDLSGHDRVVIGR